MLARRFALAVLLCACGGAQERPEPPSGAVDPGPAGLASPGAAGGGSSHDVIDATPRGAAGLVAPPPAPTPRADAPRPQEPPEPTGEATGSIVMTRAHCEALGRKFAELALAQGGVLGGVDEAGKREAEGVGKTFADRCAHDMVGQTVAAREYQCMLHARSPDGLLACKK